MTEHICRHQYPRRPNEMPNTRIIRCGQPEGHDGPHEEDDTAVTWPGPTAEDQGSM